ncbi:DUF4198 domain-containing protein [Asticcacaulis tiandongensis]|uniref:DUF4198 domain-containing protein n=1 Tax=Asticcacaulis tiandongensis TaxID=2565365 RepID=UPI001128AC86|nr:DUF4198 domain-containing protein [Asticcacaulis tiandongensis]
MKLINRLTAGAALTLILMAPVAQAHDQWLVPSATQVVLSANAERPTYVTVDGAISNGLFYPDHFPLNLSNLVITAPDGSKVEVENAHTGKLRSVFDLKVAQAGTYRVALVNEGAFASFKQNGEQKRVRGTVENIASQVPAGAEDVSITHSLSRVETFVTAGAPSELKPLGTGIELQPLQPVTDLVAGEPGKFRVLVEGKPAAGVSVKVIAGGVRYRGELGDKVYKSDANGEVSVDLPFAGAYWFNASYPPRPEEGAEAHHDHDDHEDEAPGTPQRRLSYSATLEVLPY